jgi:hypothetical protein
MRLLKSGPTVAGRAERLDSPSSGVDWANGYQSPFRKDYTSDENVQMHSDRNKVDLAQRLGLEPNIGSPIQIAPTATAGGVNAILLEGHG